MKDNFTDNNLLTNNYETILLDRVVEKFKNNDILNLIANAVSAMLVILDRQNQIVFANKRFLEFFKFSDYKEFLGKSPGEAMNCVHSKTIFSDCETSEYCRACGAIRAILEAQTGHQSEKECRLTTCSNEAHDLKIIATPFTHDNSSYTVFAIHDISHEKRKDSLERIFFHDILNSAGGISGLSSILENVTDHEDMINIAGTIKRAADNMIEEIELQRQLTAAEKGHLEPVFDYVNSKTVLNDILSLFNQHAIKGDKIIEISSATNDILLFTDQVLLRRILGNMIKNALEASLPEGVVTISVTEINKSVIFSVHNNGWMERKVQVQLFKRSFSTKGKGRGLGTYSMKLFGEKYLKGKVTFKSNKESGTTFTISIPKESVKDHHFSTKSANNFS